MCVRFVVCSRVSCPGLRFWKEEAKAGGGGGGRGDQARPQASGRERRSGGERAGGRARVYVYVAVVCKVCTWSSGEGERGHNDLWGGGERGDRTGRGIAGKALERAPPPYNPSTSGFTGKPALVLDRPGGIPQGYGLTSRRSVTEPRWVSSPPSYCATAPLSRYSLHTLSLQKVNTDSGFIEIPISSARCAACEAKVHRPSIKRVYHCMWSVHDCAVWVCLPVAK